MKARVQVKPALLRWAVHRTGREADSFAPRFPHLDAWLRGESAPTLPQLEDLMVDRMERNEDFVARYLNDPQFQAAAFPLIARQIFDTIRGNQD